MYHGKTERIPFLMKEIRSMLLKTDPDFTAFIIGERLVDAIPELVNLKEEINKVATSRYYAPKGLSKVDNAVVLHINRSALGTVLNNLWVNAYKYRINESDYISLSTKVTKHGGCILEISNPSITYTEKELQQLKSKGYQNLKWRDIDRKQRANEGGNKGLGLYLVDNICKHVLNISFVVRQENVRPDGRCDFICELIFDPSLVTGANRHG